jgi:hypothetical protein
VSMATTSGIWHATTMAAQPDRRALGQRAPATVRDIATNHSGVR